VKRILFALALAFAGTSLNAVETLSVGTPELQSISALAFGPDGLLFVGDPLGGKIVAIDTGDSKPVDKGEAKFEKLDGSIAELLGTKASDIAINDVKVNPASGRIYAAVTRKGKDGGSLIVRIGRDQKIEEFKLKDVKHAVSKLPNASEKQKQLAITSLAYADGKLIVAGLSNEEFASTLRTIKVPFESTDRGTAIEIYHAAHGAKETRSPIQTLVPYTVGKADYIIASYTCTPLVRIPISDLKPGDKVTGTTVAELGNMNRPLDIVVYSKDNKDYAFMSNSARGLMKIDLSNFEKADALTTPVKGGGTAGISFDKVESATGVKQLDRLDDKHAIVLVEEKDKSLSLKTIELP